MKKRRNKLFIFYLPAAFLVYGYIHFFFITFTPPLPSPGSPPILYSNQCSHDLRLTMLKAIKRAHSSIHLVMFGLTEPSILRNLAKKASHEKIPVNIYYDPSASIPLNPKINFLQSHPIRSTGLMHQKILVIDESMIFIGSTNMTRSSLSMHDNMILGLYSPKIARFLKEKTPHSSGHMKTLVGGQEIDIYLLPDPRGYSFFALKNLIQSAKINVKLAMFTLTHPNLIDEIIDAKRRGVDISIVVDYNSGMGSSAKEIERLKAAGVKTFLSTGSQLMHHKFVYIDNKTLALGSANWTKAAFNKNHDCFMVIHNINEEQKKFMDKLWQILEYENNAQEN